MGEQLKQQTLYDIVEENSKNIFWVDRYVSGPEGAGGTYESRRMTQDQLLDLMQNNLSFNTGIKTFKNITDFTIPKGSLVDISSVNVGVITVLPSNGSTFAGDSGSHLYVATEDVLSNDSGTFIEEGSITGFNTSSFAVGDFLYWNPSTHTIDTTHESDKMFLGIVVTQNVLGTIYVSPTRNYSLVTGNTGQVALFIGANHIESNSRFTFVDNVGVEVGFTFNDGNGNVTQVGCTLLNVETEGIAQNSVLRLANWSDSNTNTILTRKSRGTKASPSGVLANDVIGRWLGTGQHNGGAGTTTFEARVVAKENYITDVFVSYPELYRSALTEFQLWMASSFDQAFFNPPFPNNLVFYVDGNGQVGFQNYKFPIGDGTVGQFLKTDGAGNLSWQNVSGGISGVGVAGKMATWTSTNNVGYNNLIENSIIAEVGNGSHGFLRVFSSDTASNFGSNAMYKDGFYSRTVGNDIGAVLNLETNNNNSTKGRINFIFLNSDTGSNLTIPCYINQELGQINFGGYENYGIVSRVKCITTENQTLTNRGTKLVFQITKNGTATLFDALLLDGDGRIKISNAYKLPLLDGASGTSLITDGAGNVAWGTPSASASTTMQTIGRNSTGSTLYKGTIVYISGSTGNRPNFVKAQANSEATSAGTFGVVVSDIANNSDGYVATIGTLSNLDTRPIATNPFTTDILVDGDTIYLSPTNAGYITNVKPSAPNHLVYLGKVVQTSPTNGTIVYRVQNGYELDEIHDVAISGLANNHVLLYESSTQLWKNKPLSALSEDIWKISPGETYRGISLNNNSTTVVSDGGVVMSSTASTLAQSVSSTNLATKQIRLRYYASVVSAGRYTGTRGSALLWYIHGGFRFVCDFNISDTAYSVGCQQFYGMSGVTTDLSYGGVSGTLVSTLLNIVGVGSETNDANLQIFHNDASGSANKIDLGVNFPANRTSGSISTTVYQVQILNLPMSSEVQYKVVNKETGDVATGTITTDLPLNSQGLNFFASRCMSTMSSVTNSGQFDLMKLGVYSTL